ncbi:MAG: fatty acyl-AMP ligase [Bacteroidota bacterium]
MDYNNYNEILMARAAEWGDKIVYHFQEEKAGVQQISYAELDQKAKALAVVLRTIFDKGDRVLLMYAPGIPYIIAFWACLYAGIIPVPAYPPNKRNTSRLLTVVQNAGVRAALCSSETDRQLILSLLKAYGFQFFSEEQIIATETIDVQLANHWQVTTIDRDDIAFLQYTSGSTSAPKGVMITHGNLLANSACMDRSFQMHAGRHVVSWLPPFHDMGLIGAILQTIHSGASATLMSPITFIKKPFRWLKAIHEGRAFGTVVSGAPNFAYDLCVDKIKPEQLPEDMDLRHWEIAFSGAEPVRKKTLDRFAARFKSNGFQEKQFFPVYGLAEVSLLASAGTPGTNPIVKIIDSEQLEQAHRAVETPNPSGRISRYVACGHPIADGHQLRIVLPEDNTICEDYAVGEIWIKGASIAKGYWNNPEKSEYTFKATTADGEGPFLRTGDMGFLAEGQLYITGRLKDMIIINGKNHYPQDIELTVYQAHKALKHDFGVAFSIDNQKMETESLVIVQEVKRDFLQDFNVQEVIDAIKNDVARAHQLPVHTIVLVPPLSVAKTTSGKLQRQRMKKRYLSRRLAPIYTWSSNTFQEA